MYAIFGMRENYLLSTKYQLQLRIMELGQKLADLAMYGANVSDGIVSTDELMTSPYAIFKDQLNYNYKARRAAIPRTYDKMFWAKEDLKDNLLFGMANTQPPPVGLLWRGLLQASLEEVGKRQEKRIAAEEKKITMEKTKLETRFKALEAELKSCQEAKQKGIEQSAPKYA